MDETQLLETALDAARAAAAVHAAHSERIAPGAWDSKGVADYVSEVDREAERRIVELVHGRFPDHAFLAEERTVEWSAPDDAPWIWVVDPLDGTTNFLHRYPMYCASVAVLHAGEPVAGAIVQAATGEEWTARRGGGARRNGEAIHVSDIAELRHALIGTGFPFRVPGRITEHLRQVEAVLRRTSGVRRAGSAALDLCHVAAGWLDGFWELVLAPWDVAAGTLIIREAGGVVTRLDGTADVPGGTEAARHGGTILAGNPAIHGALGALVRGV